MRMLAARLKRHQINYVDDANLLIRKVLQKNIYRSECFKRGHVPGTSQGHIRLGSLVVAGPFPYTNSLRTMLDCGIHVEILQRGLLVGTHPLHVAPHAPAMM